MIGFHHKEAAVNGKDSKIERGVERCNQFYNEMKFWQIQSLYIWRKSLLTFNECDSHSKAVFK